MVVPLPQVDVLLWPTSADWVGNVRPGWQGRLAKLRNPQESLPHTRGRRHAYWDAFRFRNLGIDLLIDSGTPSIPQEVSAAALLAVNCESLCSLAVGASLNSHGDRQATATYV